MESGGQSLRLARFVGRHSYAVDGQRRFGLPKAWRDDPPEQNQFILMPGPLRSLQLIPTDLFGELIRTIHPKVLFENERDYLTFGSIGAYAEHVSPDRQGRIALPKDLMDSARITDKVMLVGAIERIQIWEPSEWEDQKMLPREWLHAFEDIARRPANGDAS